MFFKNHTENEAGRLAPDLFLDFVFFKKAVGLHISVSIYFDSPQLGIQ